MSRVIVWRVTQSCNMKCRFCSYSTQVERQRSNASEAEIARLSKIFGEHRRLSGEDILVSWIGGEPFLWKNIIPFSAALHNDGINVSATTNGLLLDRKDFRDGVVKNFSEIVFSLDGFDECDDAVRQYFGHFEAVSENIRTMGELRDALSSPLKIKVNTILMRQNISRFDEFCEYLLWLGVDEVTFNQLGGYDRPEFYADNRLTSEQAESFSKRLPLLQKEFADRGLVIHGNKKYIDRILKSSRNEANSVAECNVGEWFWFINESGFISPCSYTSYEYRFDIREIKCAEDIARVGEFFKKCRSEGRSKWCGDCCCTQFNDKYE